MDVLTPETCWTLYNEIKASDIKLVSLYSTTCLQYLIFIRFWLSWSQFCGLIVKGLKRCLVKLTPYLTVLYLKSLVISFILRSPWFTREKSMYDFCSSVLQGKNFILECFDFVMLVLLHEWSIFTRQMLDEKWICSRRSSLERHSGPTQLIKKLSQCQYIFILCRASIC